jgi:hypothetical protein
MPIYKIIFVHITLLFLLSFSSYSKSQQVITSNNPNWKLDKDGVKLEKISGRDAIKIQTGKAVLENIQLQDGIIEYDMYLSGERAFSYLYFRSESNEDHEEIYFRTHKSNAPDAVQYSPVFQRRSAWQIYHGDKGTAPVTLPANTWIKVKVELQGQKMRLWVGDNPEPVLTINQLGRKAQAGTLAFRGFVPRNSTAEYSAYYSGLKITKKTESDEKVSSDIFLPDGQITKWRVSPAFDSPKGPVTQLPELPAASLWKTPSMQSDGSFEFLRSREIPDQSRHWAVAADIELLSQRDQVCELHLGFSDEITLSVNGTLAVYQDASYRYADKRQEGLMHPEQLVAYLPLAKGSNHVRAIIADRFGGWGLSGRLEYCEGVEQH